MKLDELIKRRRQSLGEQIIRAAGGPPGRYPRWKEAHEQEWAHQVAVLLNELSPVEQAQAIPVVLKAVEGLPWVAEVGCGRSRRRPHLRLLCRTHNGDPIRFPLDRG